VTAPSERELVHDWNTVGGPDLVRDGQQWYDAARQLPTSTAPRVDVHRIGTDITLASGDLGDLLGIRAGGASLVRPDGFVAWRSSSSGDNLDCPRVLQRALAVAIGRERP
jgi:hypothetical protein